MTEQMGQPFDLLLGRKTYDIFAAYWPHQSGEDSGADPLNRALKYVVTHRPIENAWKETLRIANNVPDEIRKIKEGDGPMLQVHGSSELIQTLLANDLVDELWMKIFPVLLGNCTNRWQLDASSVRASPFAAHAAQYEGETVIRRGDDAGGF